MSRRRSKYKIPQLPDDQYFAKLDEQYGGCAICDFKPTFRRLAGDHLHDLPRPDESQEEFLKRVRRGLLCTLCNRKLVAIIEARGIDPKRIVEYFEKYPRKQRLARY